MLARPRVRHARRCDVDERLGAAACRRDLRHVYVSRNHDERRLGPGERVQETPLRGGEATPVLARAAATLEQLKRRHDDDRVGRRLELFDEPGPLVRTEEVALAGAVVGSPKEAHVERDNVDASAGDGDGSRVVDAFGGGRRRVGRLRAGSRRRRGGAAASTRVRPRARRATARKISRDAFLNGRVASASLSPKSWSSHVATNSGTSLRSAAYSGSAACAAYASLRNSRPSDSKRGGNSETSLSP
mmetsp:Transcript_26920/g.82869  ORF Transcript_26920/g.82869 Transcript_26920/m.82869 type:complete len:245 (+) Transcript_26920:540-1274(+)